MENALQSAIRNLEGKAQVEHDKAVHHEDRAIYHQQQANLAKANAQRYTTAIDAIREVMPPEEPSPLLPGYGLKPTVEEAKPNGATWTPPVNSADTWSAMVAGFPELIRHHEGMTTGDIIAFVKATTKSEKTRVYGALNHLKTRGQIVKSRHGMWSAA